MSKVSNVFSNRILLFCYGGQQRIEAKAGVVLAVSSLGLPWSVIHRDVFESSFQTNEILIDDMLAKSGLAGYCEIIKDNMEVKYSKGLWLAAFAVLGSEWPAFQKVFGADQHASDCKARKCQDCGWTPCYSAGILPTLRTVSFIWLQVQSELRRPWLGILLVLPPGCQNYRLTPTPLSFPCFVWLMVPAGS